MDRRKPAMPALTGLRTLLALSIVFFHFAPPHSKVFSPILDNGFVFVGFFFMMSGYILSYNYASLPKLDKGAFWLARLSRLYPVYLLALACSFPMLRDEWAAHSHAEFWQGLVLTPLLLQGWIPGIATFWNTVGWTLSCEIMLYLAFPYLIRIPLPSQPERLVALMTALWIIGIVPHGMYVLFNPDHLAVQADRYTGTLLVRVLKFSPPAYACTFICGLILGRLQERMPLARHQNLALAATSLAGLGLAMYLLVPHIPYIMLHGGLLMPLFAMLMLGLSGPSAIGSVFASSPLVYLGRTTFCLYLLHFNAMILIQTNHVMERLHLASLDPWISYVAIIVLAILAHRYVEVPARDAIMRIFKVRAERARAIVQPAFSKLSFSGR